MSNEQTTYIQPDDLSAAVQMERFGRIIINPPRHDKHKSTQEQTLEGGDPRVQIERFNKISAYQQGVIRPMVALLESFDPTASVLVSGSFAEFSPERQKLRVGSDCDFIVISEGLHNPMAYIRFLQNMAQQNAHFMESGVVPVAFTEVTREEEVRHIAMEHFVNHRALQHNRRREMGDHFLPIHFLFYDSYATMYRREPDRLMKSLLPKSRAVIGQVEYTDIPPSEDTYPKAFDQARWNVERALAEFILNYNLVPHDYLLRKLKNAILTTIRGPLGDTLYGAAAAGNTSQVLRALEQDFPPRVRKMREAMEPIFQIHENDRPKDDYSQETFLRPMYHLLCLIDEITAKYGGLNGNGNH